jgi:hypothetical protein
MSEFASETSQAAEEEVEDIQASPDAPDPAKSVVEEDADVASPDE